MAPDGGQQRLSGNGIQLVLQGGWHLIAASWSVSMAFALESLHLPDGAGWEVLAEIRRTRPATPVLVVTIDDDRSRALALGAADHILKPVDRDQLAAAVARLTSAALAEAA
jgi:DNA-binding response OmpR family regulator